MSRKKFQKDNLDSIENTSQENFQIYRNYWKKKKISWNDGKT